MNLRKINIKVLDKERKAWHIFIQKFKLAESAYFV